MGGSLIDLNNPFGMPLNRQIIAAVAPAGANQAVVWVSSNPYVATVDEDGWVIGLHAGTTEITATSVDGKPGSINDHYRRAKSHRNFGIAAGSHPDFR